MTAATAAKTLTPAQAESYARAHEAVVSAEAAVEEAKAERQRLRDRYGDRVPLQEKTRAGAVEIHRYKSGGGEYVDLAAAKKEHPKALPAAIRKFLKPKKQGEVWAVKRLPAKPNA